MSSNATSAVPTSLPSVPSLDNTFGAGLIGTFLGLILYGLTVHQTLTYFRVYTADAFLLKFMAALRSVLLMLLRLLDAGNAVVTMHACVNSRRSLTGSAMDESDFGTFGLGASQQNSMRIPARLEHFRAQRSEGEVIGISSWKAPADAEVKHATQSQDGDDVIDREDV
ncbi:hypothetical protein BD309DRAFT_1049388 [Dichomitus squalens]|nr:hypothetical protein BD309DRAFT_1049388 [Dichomitus squalens]